MAIICLKYRFSSKAPFVCPVTLNIFLFDSGVLREDDENLPVLQQHSAVPWQDPHHCSRSGSGGPAAQMVISSIWPFGNPFGHPQFAGGGMSVWNVLVGLS